MARQVTPNALGATIKAYIADGNDASAEAVYFGSGGQAVAIVDDPAVADIRIRVARGKRSSRFLSAPEARHLATIGAPSTPAKKPRGTFFRYAIAGIAIVAGVGVAMMIGGSLAGLALVVLSPIGGPIGGWMLMGLLSLMGLR